MDELERLRQAIDDTIEGVAEVSVDDLRALLAERETLLKEKREMDWLAENVNLELQWSEVDGDLSECAWHVFRVSGGINDREWSVIARGDTPLKALSNARAVLTALGRSAP